MDRTQRQKLGIKKWVKNGGNGILVYAVGVGKTRTALTTCEMLHKQNPNINILISVPTAVLKEQWMIEVAKYPFFSNVKIEVINTIVKSDWNVDFLIIDEIHAALAATLVSIFNRVKYRYFLGLTGTLHRLDGREEILEKYTKVVDTITMEDAIKNNWLSPYRYYKVYVNVDLSEYDKLNQKFNTLFAMFGFDFKTAMSAATDWRFRQKYAKQTGYDVKQITGFAMAWMRCLQQRKKFVMSHPKKFEIAKKIINARKDKKIITFSATIKDAESLKVGYTLHSKKKPKENKAILDKFEKATSGVLNSSKSLNAGLNIPDINCEIIISGTSSNIDAVQRLGRSCRYVDGKIAEIFVLVIKGTNEDQWFNRAAKGLSYQTIQEHELDIVLEKGYIETRQQDDNISEYRF